MDAGWEASFCTACRQEIDQARLTAGVRVAERIEQVRKLDLIGQAVIQTMAEIDMAISGAMRTII